MTFELLHVRVKKIQLNGAGIFISLYSKQFQVIWFFTISIVHSFLLNFILWHQAVIKTHEIIIRNVCKFFLILFANNFFCSTEWNYADIEVFIYIKKMNFTF